MADEITDLDVDFNLDDFGLLSILPEDDDKEEKSKEDDILDTRPASVQHNVFENQERMQFPILNYDGIPVLKPTQTSGENFSRFMDYLEIDAEASMYPWEQQEVNGVWVGARKS